MHTRRQEGSQAVSGAGSRNISLTARSSDSVERGPSLEQHCQLAGELTETFK